MTASDQLLWLDDLGTEDIAHVGGKLARLGALAKAGFDVPRGFAIGVDALTCLMPSGVESQLASGLDEAGTDMAAIERMADEARTAIETSPLPADLGNAIANCYARLGPEVQTAVRSSGVSEDGDDASFAGQFDTYLGISGADAVCDAVRRCFASQFTARALDYARRKGVTPGAGGMAVGVLEMVPARCAGIAMTVDPVARRTDHVVVEASFGLGEATVSGQVTPDRWVVDKGTLEVVDARIAVKEVWSEFDPDAREVVTKPMPGELREETTLSLADLQSVVNTALRIEELEGSAQDVEWAIAGDGDQARLVLLQHRPETTINNAPEPFDPVAYAMRNVLGVPSGGTK